MLVSSGYAVNSLSNQSLHAENVFDFRTCVCVVYSVRTGPVCSLKPVSRAPVSGLNEFPHTGGLSIKERNELPS